MDAVKLIDVVELPAERRADRETIETLYRRATGRDVGLAASEEQWAFFEALLSFGRETFRYTFDGIDPDDQTALDLIKDAEGVIEMTDEEQFRMYEKETAQGRLWSRGSCGVMLTLGYIASMPITITLYCVIWQGHKFVLWHMPSTVVDHRMADKFLKENMPLTAFESPACLNRSDATNAHNVLHAAKRMKEKAA